MASDGSGGQETAYGKRNLPSAFRVCLVISTSSPASTLAGVGFKGAKTTCTAQIRLGAVLVACLGRDRRGEYASPTAKNWRLVGVRPSLLSGVERSHNLGVSNAACGRRLSHKRGVGMGTAGSRGWYPSTYGLGCDPGPSDFRREPEVGQHGAGHQMDGDVKPADRNQSEWVLDEKA